MEKGAEGGYGTISAVKRMGSLLSAVAALNSGISWMMRSADQLDAALSERLVQSADVRDGFYLER